MWTKDDVEVEIVLVEHEEMIVCVTTPVGIIELVGSVSRIGRVLLIDGAHVQGLTPGALNRAGLNAIGRKFMEAADVDEIIIQGGVRTTGRNQGKAPKRFRFPNQS